MSTKKKEQDCKVEMWLIAVEGFLRGSNKKSVARVCEYIITSGVLQKWEKKWLSVKKKIYCY